MKYWQSIKFGLLLSIVSIVTLATPLQYSCAASEVSDPDGCFSAAASGGKDTFLKTIPASYTLEQPLGVKAQVANIGEYINIVYRYALGIVGILATVLIMAGGLIWLSSAGNEQLITQGKEIITSAVVGLVIALFSYSILYWINPQFTVLNMDVFKIPIPQKTYQCQNVPVVEPIANTDGLAGNGQYACISVTKHLEAIIKNILPAKCGPSCKINVSSAYRDGDKQAVLYDCYQRSKTEGSCPADCNGNCNEAAKPCCSDHNRGLAVDVCLVAPNIDGVVSSSCAYMSTAYNNGGNDTNAAAIKANQDLLKTIMESDPGDGHRFQNYGGEWWHFKYQGQCNDVLVAESTSGACSPLGEAWKDPLSGQFYNADAYHYCHTNGSSLLYSYALCSNGASGVPVCPNEAMSTYDDFVLAADTCISPETVDFGGEGTATTGPSGLPIYAVIPNCQ